MHENHHGNHKIIGTFIVILIISATAYLSILSWNALKSRDYIGVSEEQRHSIRIDGIGKAIGTPDIAKIQLGYKAEKKTVAEAQTDNTEKMNTIIEKLKKDFNIDKKDIQTSNYNINAQYDWNEGERTLRGYQVSQNLNIKIRDLEKVSQILDAAGTAGLNQVGNLRFDIDNQEILKEEARTKALKNAKEKAEKLASELDVKLGRIISFNESGNQPMPSPIYRSYAIVEEKDMGGAAPEIEAGSTEIIINATIEYEIL